MPEENGSSEKPAGLCSCPEPDYQHGGCNICGLPVDPEHPWVKALVEANAEKPAPKRRGK